MVNLRSELRAAIADAIRRGQEAGDLPHGEVPEIPVEYPPDVGSKRLGDYASPVALSLAKQWKRQPMDIVEALRKQLAPLPFVKTVEAVAPGFLNFTLDSSWLSTKIDDLIEEGSALGRSDAGRGASINLEFGSVNPTGFPHVGHGRSLFFADVLGNVLTHTGYVVTREYYVNDMGTQVARYGESVLRRILQADGHAVEFPAELYQGEEVHGIAAQVREELVEDRGHAFAPADLQNPALLAEITRRAVAVTMREIRRVLEELAGIRYDVWFLESTLHERGDVREVLEALRKKGHTYERDGAVWLKTTAFGDTQDRVLVKSGGEPTYLTPDIAYHRDKFRRGFQVLADFWGADHHGHVAPLRAGLTALGEDVSRLWIGLVHLVRVLQGGEAKKASKRLGTAVPLHELLVLIGSSATRFFLTSKPLSTPLDLDLDLARAQKEENPVYYAQYAYVRLAGILRKAKEQNLVQDSMTLGRPETSTAALHETETRLLTLGFRLPEVLEDIARTWEVQRLPQYALEFARAVHRFYDTVPVLRTEERDLLRTRLALTVAARTALAKVFDLLGVEKREVM
ncbi:MAG: arginine--tRNA ligase [bacterium]|nr:arginine--tRNA ligase [bacterium]